MIQHKIIKYYAVTRLRQYNFSIFCVGWWVKITRVKPIRKDNGLGLKVGGGEANQ